MHNPVREQFLGRLLRQPPNPFWGREYGDVSGTPQLKIGIVILIIVTILSQTFFDFVLNIPLMKLVEVPSRVVGAAPVIRGMADAIGFVDLLNTLLPWDPFQCRTSPGERILAISR